MEKILNSIKKFLNRRNVRYGTNAAVLTVVFIAVILMVNILVNQFSTLKWDISVDKIYSISKETQEILKGLNTNITIYGFYDEGKEPKEITELLDQYKKESKYITVQYVDIDKNPGLAQKLDPDKTGIDKGSLLVASDSKSKKISSYDLIDYDLQTQQATGLKTEQRITSGIQYVTSEKNPTVYFIKGHEEEDPYTLKNELESDNFVVKSMTLIEKDKVPEDADTIIFVSPKRDLSLDDKAKVKAYLDQGGKAMFLFDINNSNPDMPLFGEILSNYNVSLHNDVAVEDDEGRYLPKNPLYIITKANYHDITSRLTTNNLDVVLPASRSIAIAKNKKEGISETPLLQTTEKAWGETNMNAAAQKDGNDIVGPLDLAVAVQKEDTLDTKASKIVVVGDAEFINDTIVEVSPGNMEFVRGSLNWLQDITETTTVATKYFTKPVLRMSEAQVITVAVVVLFVLPIIILGSGTVVWLRRRHL